MSRHETPREDLPAVEIPDLACDPHEFGHLVRIVKHKLAAGYTAVHVIGRSGDKKTWLSRHGVPPMRGRDTAILLNPSNPSHNATMLRVAPMMRQRFKIKYKLMTTDAVYDKEILISSHLERRRRESANQNQLNAA